MYKILGENKMIINKNNLNYHEKQNIELTLKLRELMTRLPDFAKDFFRGIEPKTSAKTRVSYAYDLRIFFDFLLKNNPVYKNKCVKDIGIDALDNIKALDIEEYLEYLKLHEDDKNNYVTNSQSGIKRKLSSLRSFYSYFFKRELIKTNPTLLVDMPKLYEKAIIRLDNEEISELLEYIENCGKDLKGQKKLYYEKTKLRDLSMIALMLGTGIRVSECVGLDINDVNFKENGIKITRKGGNEMIVYFGEDVADILSDYIEERIKVTALSGYENALFLSTQRKRINVRTVENMVKKYTSAITPNKKITPHKLRSSYGTALYRETGDIYLVADVLGHKDVNTTRKHYAAIDENRRKSAADFVKLKK